MFNLPSSVLVTGAASGIGRATALRLAQAGCQVLALDRDERGLAQLAGESGAEAVTGLPCDLGDARDLERAFEQAAALGYGGAVNCAGVEGKTDVLLNQGTDDISRVIDLNVKATLACLREEMRHLLARGTGGSIVNLASIYGLRGQPRWVVYSASKAAVVGMTQGAALEMAQAGIRVNAVAPGPIETPLLARSTQGDYARTAAMVPLKRNGQPAEVVGAIEWLLGDGAAFVTGAVIPVDGGMVAQAVAQAPAAAP